MNGVGKTSFLLAMYLGLFGRFGLRHAEGFSHVQNEELGFYRQALAKFRRNGAPADEPTVVDVVFAPTDDEREQGLKEIRIVRRWFFTADGKPRQGDNFEEVTVYLGDKLQSLSSVDAAVSRIERHLFPASFMPGFFFDGEQAQTLVNNAGEAGIKKAVEVLFGTKVLHDAAEAINQHIGNARSRIGGQRSLNAQQQELDSKLRRREELEALVREANKRIVEIGARRTALEKENQSLNEQLARLGGSSREKIEEVVRQHERATAEVDAAEDELFRRAAHLGASLSVSRLAPSILNRLEGERIRESWEAIRVGTINRTDEVLRVALPEPPESDALLGHLPLDRRSRVRERFRLALEQIYHPPPDGCASEYLLGHVKGEMRERLVELVQRLRRTSSTGIQQIVRRLKDAREAKRDAELKRARLSDLPREVQEISDKLKQVVDDLGECTGELRAIERENEARRAELKAVNGAIGQLQEQLASLAPDQKRIAIAERCKRTLEALEDQLRPLALKRMQSLVTSHFTSIADRRYRDGEIEFPDGQPPVFRRSGHADYLIEMMSGFERRSFGIAFSLSLVELTGTRMPIVIDTPLGNADSEYRPRLLKALTSVDVDQIIVLTHDREITQDLFEQIESQVQQHMLVDFDGRNREAVIRPDAFFHGIGA